VLADVVIVINVVYVPDRVHRNNFGVAVVGAKQLSNYLAVLYGSACACKQIGRAGVGSCTCAVYIV
jgi:hypothetical protein